MAIIDTPRFRKLKKRKRDNWTSQRLAYKIFGCENAWPVLGLTYICLILLFGPLGYKIPAQLGGAFGLISLGIGFFWLPLLVLAIVDEGHGFGVFIGWAMWWAAGSATRKDYLERAERKLALTDEDLLDRYICTRPESSR